MASNKINIVITAQDQASKPLRQVSEQIDGTSSSASKFNSIMAGAGKAALVAGAAGYAALATGAIASSKASWDQVSAVEQATLALRAYEKDGGKVNAVLSDLVKYARSDMGVLFNRRDLFESAQNLKLYGDNTAYLTDHVKILSRSVGLGLSNWDGLNNVIGRVGSTGRLYADDLQYLQNAGFKLDKSLSGSTQTFESLFALLDKGIPVDAMNGQATTIQGLGIRMQTAFRGVGDSILGVDKESNKFVEGGLGDRFRNAMITGTNLLKSAAPVAGDLTAKFLKLTDGTVSFLVEVGRAKGLLITLAGGFVGYKAAIMATTLVTKAQTIALSANIVAQNATKMALLTSGQGFLGYQSVLMATTTKTTAAMFAQQALNKVMMLNPYALVAGAVIGITGAYINAVTQTDRSSEATQRLKTAQEGLTQAQRDAKVAQDDLSGANLNLEGSQLRVEGAQIRVKDALANYGPQSLEYRQAVLDEKLAEEDLKRSKQAVADATDNKAKANQKVIDQEKEVKESSKRIAEQVNAEARNWAGLGQSIGQAREAAGGKKDSKSGGDNIKLPANPFSFGNEFRTYASGTNSTPGGDSLVGEHGPERVRLPQGAQVIPAYRTRSDGASSSGGHTVIIQNMNINNGGDEHRLLSDIGFALETAS